MKMETPLATTPPGEHEWAIKEWRLIQLEKSEKDLCKAKKLIARMRAEKEVMRDRMAEYQTSIAALKRDAIETGKSYATMYAYTMALVKLDK